MSQAVLTSAAGYHQVEGNLFYYDEGPRSFTLVATPGGGKRWVFTREHPLYGPLVNIIYESGVLPHNTEEMGFTFAKRADNSSEKTVGQPVLAPSYAWLEVFDYAYASRKPLVLRPAFWATAAIGAVGIGYAVYAIRRKTA